MSRHTLNGLKVLVVDDEEMIREAIVELLLLKGCTVRAAPSGNKAFEMVQHENFDAVVTDVRMPDGDGVSLIQRMIEKMPERRPPVIVVSGFSDVTQAMADDLRIFKILQKPFTMDDLTGALLRIA